MTSQFFASARLMAVRKMQWFPSGLANAGSRSRCGSTAPSHAGSPPASGGLGALQVRDGSMSRAATPGTAETASRRRSGCVWRRDLPPFFLHSTTPFSFCGFRPRVSFGYQQGRWAPVYAFRVTESRLGTCRSSEWITSRSSSTISRQPLPSSPHSAWRSRARCRSKARGWTASTGSKT